MEVPDRKELLETAMSAPGKAWKNAREAIDGLGSLEIGSGLALKISDIPQDALEWSKGTWEDSKKSSKRWWQL